MARFELLTRIGAYAKIRFAGLTDYYLFEKAGHPRVRNDKISKAVIRRLAPTRPIVIDCGAHDGADTLQLARLLNATVYAFEPVPELFARLVRRVGGDHRIHCLPIALGSEDGTAQFNVSSGASDASGSLLEPTGHLREHPNVLFKDTIQVETRRLDSWMRESKLNRVDVLWLDMQGAEIVMLKAAESILKEVSVIHTEVSLSESYAGGALYDELRRFLESRGFRVELEAIPVGWSSGNVLFVRC